MASIFRRDRTVILRAHTDALIGSSHSSPSSDGSYLSTPRLDIDILDTSPFSGCFSSWFDDENHTSETVHSASPSEHTIDIDTSYDIKNYTNIRDLNPHWDHHIDEIMVLSKKHKNRLPKITEEIAQSHSRKKSISVSDFDPLHTLGKGTTGEIILCRKRDNSKLYGLKIVRHINGGQARLEHDNLKAVQSLSSPFLSKMHWSFQDSERIYFVMDFYPGGNLLIHLMRHEIFHPDRAHFYACEIVEGISALHSAGIIHRDLKPENILVDAHGHIVLSGFDCAKNLGTDVARARRTATLRGTKEYQAPEMLLGWVHDFSVDCWGFGILLYTMLFGRHPFVDDCEPQNQAILRSKIVHGPTPFQPAGPVGTIARDLVAKCLERNPAARYNIEQIKTHRYFSGIDWIRVASKAVTVPWIPELDESQLDLRYFDKQVTMTGGGHVSPTFRAHTPPSLSVPQALDGFNGSPAKSELQPIKDFTVLPRAALKTLRPISIQTTSRGNKKHTSRLDVVFEVQDEEELYEPRTAMDLSNGVDFEGRLREQLREQVANNRASFWDTLDDEESVDSGNFLDFKDALNLSKRRPHRLRKQKPSALVAERVASVLPDSTARRTKPIWKRVQIVSSLPSMVAKDSPSVNLPTGIFRTGHGIGFTCNLGIPASKASVCTTPLTCRGWFSNKFFSRSRKAKQRPCQEYASSTDEDREIAAVMKEIYGSSWSPEMSAVDTSLPLTTSVADTPHTLWSGLAAPEELTEAISGDPDTTLRLVTPSSLPLYG